MGAEIYLASSSPRREMLLRQIGVPFTRLVKPVDESVDPNLSPARQVEIVAERKATGVAGELNRGLVIGADTIVVCNGRVMGKPGTPAEALEMLLALQGNTHEVYTGLFLQDVATGRVAVAHEKTLVRLRRATVDELERYVATGEPMDKAGAYAAQGMGAIFIEEIRGCYYNVVGLPLMRLVLMLRQFGVDVTHGWGNK